MKSATEMLAADGRQVRHRAFDVWNIREDFPILTATGAWEAAGLPRQRRHEPETAGGDRYDTALLRGRKCQYSPWCLLPE